ncbi:DUF308 domain-containing protein [Luteimonas sp. XNQY3]|nr:DUF308 domain-containing protein [Luteimonas sp. XNQY3]MCD9007034.1 DUF308 domain-containing protein [Luteimonas sp. XNQY3]
MRSSIGIFGEVTRSWWLFLVYGLLAVAFAGVAVFRPLETVAVLVVLLGVLALAEGVVSLVAAFAGVALGRGWVLLYALASIAFGLLAILRPASVATVLVLLLAAWLLVGGIYRIIFAIRVRKAIEGEWAIALSGVLAVILGVLFAVAPAAGMLTMMLWIGVGALFYGILQIVIALRLRRLHARTPV